MTCADERREDGSLARTSTVHRFELDISDTDRGYYESLDLRAARHPSESSAYLLTRVLAYALNAGEGIEFTSGLSTPEEPAIAVRDLTGALQLWIDVGQPTPERMQKALGQSEAVAVYTYKSPDALVASIRAAGDARLDAVSTFAIAPAFLSALEGHLDRRNRWSLVHTEGELFITIDDATIQGQVTRL